MGRPNAVTIFCEDVRPEISGTTTLIGILPDQLTVPSVPGALPKLCAYTRTIVPVDTPVTSMFTVLIIDGEEGPRVDFDPEMLKSSQEGARAKGSPSIGFVGTIAASPFVVEHAMSVRAVTWINGEEHLTGYINLVVSEPTE